MTDIAEHAAVARPLIVGIGASAGGLEAFSKFLSRMPAESGMAFVLVQHLDPAHDSMLVELLGRKTAMPVAAAEDGLAVVANRVYVITANTTLTIRDGVLRVTAPAPERPYRRPIDTFFISLAEDQGERAVCLVLSGLGSDGSLGLTAIKEHGGLVLAEAEFDSTAKSGMPQSAANTGLVDQVIIVDDMPALLLDYKQHLTRVAENKDQDGLRLDTAEHLGAITAVLRGTTGHDFGQYKQKTLIRRIQRRMQVLRIETALDFLERLRSDPREIDLLFREFLIGVTQFFRDPEAFEALRAIVIPELLKDKSSDDEVRVWVPGCSTGEEVYSIAILIREAMNQRGIISKVKVFGTDIDDEAVSFARAARYPRNTVGVPPDAMERWFSAHDGDYCPRKEIREMCIFSVHSVVKDPPFSRLDMVSCRNLLIYLDDGLQDRVIQAFHFGLRPAGYLFLGQSESLQRATKLFSVIDEKHRIFKRIDVPERHGLSLPFSQPASHETRISSVAKFPSHGRDRIDNGIRRVMERHSPAFAVVNRQNDILRFSGGSIGRYLEPSAGVAHLNLLGMLLSRLRPAVHKALDDARAMHVSVTSDRVAIPVEGETHAVRIIVEPLPEGGAADELCLVAFQDEGPVVSPRAPNDDVDPYFRAMEAELDATKAQLWEITQNADRAEEDLRSVNEEYQSINEELQSSIEELETAKEEMQSINEELQTVNAELIGKNDALLRSNSDLQNLNDSTHIATIFLDSSLRIKSFTAGATNLFFMRASDRGRPITEIAARVPYPALPSDVEQVLRTTSIIERELGLLAEGQSVYIMRIRPYLTVEKVMDGVVITFVDITERKRHEESKARLAAIIESSQDAIIGHGLDGKVVSWNAAAERIFGYTADEAIGRPISIILPQDESKELPDIVSKLIAGEAIEHFETDRTRKDGSRIDVSITISPVLGATGDVIGAATIAREITDRKVAEAHKNLLIAELDHRVKNTLMTVSSMIRQTLRSSDSPRAFADVMLGRIQALGRVHQLLTQDSWDRASLREMVEGELAPYRSAGQNITISGNADVMLTAKATQSLAMALHELATNAVKYGSLSISGGEVAVSWRVTEDEAAQRLVIEWVESGGPTVKEPTRRGFGSDLIERTVTHDLKATVRRDFVPTGLQCRMEVPLTDGTGSAGPEEKADAG